ncbi:hypothetical protein [Haladaptatus sp. NG-SE-30]
MTISTPELTQRLHDHEARSILVRGQSAPATDENVVTFDAGIVAACRGDHWQLPLYVTVQATERTRRQFEAQSFADAISHTEQMLREHTPDGVWLRDHERLVDFLSPLSVGTLETRVSQVAGKMGTTFVTWTGETTPANESVYDRVVGP